MKCRVFIASVILFVLVTSAVAQSYEIRVAWRTRLRESYSLVSAIAEVVEAGSVLQVVGRFNRWLKIDRDGRQSWMADWIDHVRLDEVQTGAKGTGGAVAPVSAEIDNCCFVNRQCATDQQWVDGYWAYQRNECPGTPIEGAPTAGARHAVWIDGSPPFIDFINEALDWLRSLSPTWYDYVITGADRISENPEWAGGAEAAVWERHIRLSRYEGWIRWREAHDSMADVLSVLVHEACHIHRHEAGYSYDGYTQVDEEWACIQQENRFARVLPARFRTYHRNIFGTHCSGDLTNHWRCRYYRNNCTYAADGIHIVSCP